MISRFAVILRSAFHIHEDAHNACEVEVAEKSKEGLWYFASSEELKKELVDSAVSSPNGRFLGWGYPIVSELVLLRIGLRVIRSKLVPARVVRVIVHGKW